jgi:hypothetical protein
MSALAELLRDPEFRRRARWAEADVIDHYFMGRKIDLARVARVLEVPLPMACVWLAMIAAKLGEEKIELRVTGGLPQ